MKKRIDVHELAMMLALALDNKDWSLVEECFKKLQEYKRA